MISTIFWSSTSTRRVCSLSSWCTVFSLAVMVMWATRQPQTTTAFVPTTTDVSTSGTNGLRNGRPIVLPSQRVLNIEKRQRQIILTGKKSQKKSNTQLYFMGSDGGILGIGTPELVSLSVFISFLVPLSILINAFLFDGKMSECGVSRWFCTDFIRKLPLSVTLSSWYFSIN